MLKYVLSVIASRVFRQAMAEKAVARGQAIAGDARLVSALVYLAQVFPVLGTAVAAIAFLATSGSFVKYNALQALVLSLAYLLLAALLRLSMAGALLSMVLSLAAFLSWLYLALKAYGNEKVRLPEISAFCERHSR